MITRLKSIALLLSAGWLATVANAIEVTFQPVAPGLYAFVGEKGARTYDNEGLNANIGLVVVVEGRSLRLLLLLLLCVIICLSLVWRGPKQQQQTAGWSVRFDCRKNDHTRPVWCPRRSRSSRLW